MQFPYFDDFIKLFDWVWGTSVKVSILIILLLLIKYFLKNKIGARLHYILWSVVIISLILPWTLQSSLNLYNFINLDTRQTLFFKDITNSLLSNNMINVIYSEVEANAPQSIAISPFLHKILFYMWMIGIVGFILVTIEVNRRFALSIQGQPVADTKLLTVLKKVKQNLNIKKEILLIQTEYVASPSLYSLFHPRLLIPVRLMKEFDSEQLSHVFLHELLHFKRKDLWVNWITQGLLALHWFNPLVWYAFLRLREDQEMACDAFTLEHLGANNAKNYAYTLIALLEKNSNNSRITSLVSLSGTQSQIGRRIMMIKAFHKTSIKWSLFVIGIVVALTFVSLSNARVNALESLNNSSNTSSAVQVQPNKLKYDDWTLTITKVFVGKVNSTPPKIGSSIYFSFTNNKGLDESFLPNGKILGVVGGSGKFYDLSYLKPLDEQYTRFEEVSKKSALQDGKPFQPGILNIVPQLFLDDDEQYLSKVIYQDENGNRIEIPIQVTTE